MDTILRMLRSTKSLLDIREILYIHEKLVFNKRLQYNYILNSFNNISPESLIIEH